MNVTILVAFLLGYLAGFGSIAFAIWYLAHDTQAKAEIYRTPIEAPTVIDKLEPTKLTVSLETVSKATQQIIDEVRARGSTISPEAARQHALEMLAIL